MIVRMQQYRKAKREMDRQFGSVFSFAPAESIFSKTEEPATSWEKFTSSEFMIIAERRRAGIFEGVHPAVKRAPFLLGMPGCWAAAALGFELDGAASEEA